MATQENHDNEFDLFESILSIEETKTREGFKQGHKVQQEKFNCEGFNLGLTKGFEIGNEIAFYQAFAQTWLDLPQISSKEKKVLEQLLKLTQEFPQDNSEEKAAELKLAVNAKFKQASAILKLKSKHKCI